MRSSSAADTSTRQLASPHASSRIRRSRDIGASLGLVPRRYQSGEVDYVGGISKCGDRRVRTLLYEAANVMLSTMRKARVALARRLAIIMHAMLLDGTEFAPA
jgi:transposase